MILAYHNLIRDEEIDWNLYRRSYEGAPMLYYRSKTMFNHDMARVMINITLEDLIAGKEGAAITFDDGHYNNYDIGFSVLRAYALRATFFVPTAFIGKPGYCTWEQLKEMSDYGCEIGSHTHNHVPLDDLSAEEVEYELKTSKDLIEKHVGKCRYLSLPAGRRFDTSIARKLGYEGIRTSERGMGIEPYNLEVVAMLNNSELTVQ